MPTTREIYQTYQIMPQLQQHQFRVAAVARQICENFDGPLDTDNVVRSSLIHDMGNLLKFDLTYYPEALEPQGLAYWQQIKAGMLAKYGPDEHQASIEIARELNAGEAIISYLDVTGFRNVSAVYEQPDYAKKICCYADMRVAPFGVTSIADRLADGHKRYARRTHQALNPDNYNPLARDLSRLEKQIFARTGRLTPAGITDESVRPIIPELQNLAW